MKNPMLQENFVFSSMSCKPLIPKVLKALGMEHEVSNSLWGEGGPAAYEMCFEVDGHDELFVFSNTDMTQEKWSDRFLRWAAVGRDMHLFIAAPAFSNAFMRDLARRQHAPVYFVVAQDDDPPFRQISFGEGGPSLDKAICPECHLDIYSHGRGILMCPEGTRRMKFEGYQAELHRALNKKDVKDPEDHASRIEFLKGALEWFDPNVPDPEDVPEASPEQLAEVEDLLQVLKPKDEEK